MNFAVRLICQINKPLEAKKNGVGSRKRINSNQVLSKVEITNQFFKDLEKVASINRNLTLENNIKNQNEILDILAQNRGSNKKVKKKARKGL